MRRQNTVNFLPTWLFYKLLCLNVVVKRVTFLVSLNMVPRYLIVMVIGLSGLSDHKLLVNGQVKSNLFMA